MAKNHQYLGVNKAIAQMIKLREAGDIEAAKRLGVFWHTQGSSKSLSMVFFTQKILLKLPGKWTFVIVTDPLGDFLRVKESCLVTLGELYVQYR